MKKRAILFFLLIISLISILSVSTYAESLNSLGINLSENTIKPGEDVTLTVNFGTSLGSYTFDFAYDKNVFEYVSTTGGEVNDNGTRVRVYYFDSTGGNNPKQSFTITFKSKSTITTETTSQIKITAEGLASSDASVQYDDITNQIIKNITIKPDTVAQTPASSTTTENTTTNTTTTPTPTPVATAKQTPKTLPKTGANLYLSFVILIVALSISFFYISKKK